MKLQSNMIHSVLRGPFCRLMSTSSSFQVLRLGPTRYAQASWDTLATEKNVSVLSTKAHNRAEFIEELKAGTYADLDYITRTIESIAETGRIDEEMVDLLKKYTKVKAISHNGAGYDQVDAVACGKAGIQVSNVPSLVDDATADTHIYLLLGAMRNFQQSTVGLLQGRWPTEKCAGAAVGHDPEGKVLGILGMGGIGRAIRDRMKPFGLSKVIYHNRNRLSPLLEAGAKYVSEDELFAQADIISVSIPLNPHTHHLIDSESIAKMKDGVVIVNTARGAVINEKDLIAALKSGKVGAFGTDVFENEPNADPELIKLPNVTALPHMGTYTIETLKAMEVFVVQNVYTFIDTGKVLSLVPEQKGLF